MFGIDIDHCIENNTMNEIASEVVSSIKSYTETSPSGTGIHILCKGELPKEPGRRNDNLGLEMYDTGRFFTVTGKALKGYSVLNERTTEVKYIHEKYMKKPEKKSEPKREYSNQVIDLSDREVLDKMFSSTSGSAIKALYCGDMSAYANDHSRADQALANHLVYWTNGNYNQADSLFRQSSLMRDKWDERHGAYTYGEMTMQKAFDDFIPYEPPTPVKSTKKEIENSVPDAAERIKNIDLEGSNLNYILDMTDGMEADIADFSKCKDRKTGYSNLDALNGLYNGLYVIGAVSSLGKTSFTYQLGDQLAKAGETVLYFSLEQSRLELVTKSISRILAQNDFSHAVTSLDIRKGYKSPAINKALEEYKTYADNMHIVECNFKANIEFIKDYVNRFISVKGIKPVIIIDYLQIIPPSRIGETTKDAVDNNVRALKKMQSDNDLLVFVISSINRTNYLSPIDFESFKESGGIEYTADVIWGLQLEVLYTELFTKDKQIIKKRQAVKEAKMETPRKLVLECLKNRYGKSNYSVGFSYYSAYDLFIPNNEFEPAIETPFDGDESSNDSGQLFDKPQKKMKVR